MTESHKTVLIWAGVILTGLIVGVICYRIAISDSPVSVGEIGITDILAFGLSLFAIWMSVSFYHKASESANRFYDNTYKFTSDVSEVLGRIEGVFGEQLRHIDARVSSLPTSISNISEEIERVKEEKEAANAERDALQKALEETTAQSRNERVELVKRYEQAVEDNYRAANQIELLESRLANLIQQQDTTSRHDRFAERDYVEDRRGSRSANEGQSALQRRSTEVMNKIYNEVRSQRIDASDLQELMDVADSIIRDLDAIDRFALRSVGWMAEKRLSQFGLRKLTSMLSLAA